MILNGHLKDLKARLGDEEFLRPDYGTYSFALITAFVELLLGTKKGSHPFSGVFLPRVALVFP